MQGTQLVACVYGVAAAAAVLIQAECRQASRTPLPVPPHVVLRAYTSGHLLLPWGSGAGWNSLGQHWGLLVDQPVLAGHACVISRSLSSCLCLRRPSCLPGGDQAHPLQRGHVQGGAD